MRGASGVEDATLDALPAILAEIRIVRRARLNVLISVPSPEAVIDFVRSDLEPPVTIWRGGQRLVLPPADVAGTLILFGVDTLDRVDQQRLFDWLGAAAEATVISSATHLWRSVERGTFMNELYYRLNTVFLRSA